MGLLRRDPEQGGFDFWVNSMDLGVSDLGLIDNLLASDEYATRFTILPWKHFHITGKGLPVKVGFLHHLGIYKTLFSALT